MTSQPTLIPEVADMRPDRYRELKETVRAGLSTFIEVGLALIEIRQGRGYIYDHHQTFEDFMGAEFDVSLGQGYRLVDSARVSLAVSPIGETPRTESQARALVPLLPADTARPMGGRPVEWRPDTDEHLIDTWRFITEEYGPEPDKEPVTAKVIKKWVRHKLLEIRPELAVDIPIGVFSTIVADPPWPIQKIQRDERPNQHVIDYPTMTIQEIKDLAPEVMSRSHDDAHLYLWTTHKMLPQALEVMKAWDYNYQCVLTWVKNVGFTPFSWMYSTELVLFGRRGNLPLLKNGLRLDFNAKTTGHSIKPEAFFDLVHQASPGPYLELFARTKRDGWTTWGNDASLAD